MRSFFNTFYTINIVYTYLLLFTLFNFFIIS